MIYVCDTPNYNPMLGPVKDGMQSVSVYDRKLGNRRTVVATPEEVDQYVNDRHDVIQSAAKKGWKMAGLLTAAGTAIGVIAKGVKNCLNQPQIEGSLKKLFDPKILKEIGIKNITKGVGEAAAIVGVTAWVVGLFIPAVKAERADKEITNNFIDEHK